MAICKINTCPLNQSEMTKILIILMGLFYLKIFYDSMIFIAEPDFWLRALISKS